MILRDATASPFARTAPPALLVLGSKRLIPSKFGLASAV